MKGKEIHEGTISLARVGVVDPLDLRKRPCIRHKSTVSQLEQLGLQRILQVYPQLKLLHNAVLLRFHHSHHYQYVKLLLMLDTAPRAASA